MRTIHRSPLAKDWNQRKTGGYDIVVIGSGYGGAVTAARLATATWPGAPPSICILERGKEWLPGKFPDTLESATGETRNALNPLGLYDSSFNPDIAIIMGSGLGGTSLVNANCAIQPDPDLFDDPRWPEPIRQARNSGQLQTFYDRAKQTLAANPHPHGLDISKVKALQLGAAGMADSEFHLHNIVVNFDIDGANLRGVDQQPCINCGDCVTGCNVGSKNTLDTNYLAIAKNGGAAIFTQVEVDFIEKVAGGGYLVHYTRREDAETSENGTLLAVRMVVVAAGVLGSTGILLRARKQGLSLPDAVGTRFSGNGDFFGLSYNGDNQINCLGWGAHPDSDRAKRMQVGLPPGTLRNPGPTIVGYVKFNKSQPLRKRMKFDDLSVPLLYVDAARFALALTGGRSDNAVKAKRWNRDFFEEDTLEQGAANFSLVYLVNGHDSADGRIKLNELTDEAVIEWPGIGGQAVFQTANQLLRQHAEALGGKFVENPMWSLTPVRTLITAHPLGGCPMGEDQTQGAVNHLGQVFDENGNLQPGLYVADAAIIPTSIGVNPFLTISALAERRAEALVRELGGVP
jgi:cholesterol oxidase